GCSPTTSRRSAPDRWSWWCSRRVPMSWPTGKRHGPRSPTVPAPTGSAPSTEHFGTRRRASGSGSTPLINGLSRRSTRSFDTAWTTVWSTDRSRCERFSRTDDDMPDALVDRMTTYAGTGIYVDLDSTHHVVMI